MVLLFVLLIAGGGLFGILQLNTSQNYIANQLEESFNNRFYGELTIGDLNGLLPFRMEITELSILAPTNPGNEARLVQQDTVVTVSRVNTQIDLWSLLQNKLSITDFQLDNPRVRLLTDNGNTYSLADAFQPRELQPEQQQTGQGRWIQQVEIIAPSLSVNNGSLYIQEFLAEKGSPVMNFPEPFRIDSINTTMFLEVSEFQRFLDIENFTAGMDQLKMQSISFAGQIYNDSSLLELNSFNITTPLSQLTVSGQISGVNLDEQNLAEQLPSARYNLDMSSEKFVFAEFSDFISDIPTIKETLTFSVAGAGSLDSLQLDHFDFGIGESYVSIGGLFNELDSPEDLNYQLEVQELYLREQDLEQITGPLTTSQGDVLESLRMKGKTSGTADSLNMNLTMQSPAGSLSLSGYTRLKEPFKYNGSLSAQNIDASPFMEARIDTTNLNMDASFNGVGFDPMSGVHNFSATVYNSLVGKVGVDEVDIESTLIDGFLEHNYVYRTANEELTGSGWIDFSKQEPQFALKGNAANLDLARYFRASQVPSTSLDLDYNIELRGLQPNRISGRANLDVKQSIVGQDTLQPHQIYMDLDSPDLQSRTFRLTSTLFDLTISGDIQPTNIYNHTRYWSSYLGERIRHEILLDSLAQQPTVSTPPEPLSLQGQLQAKNLELVRNYWQNLPVLSADSRLNFDLKADSNRMLLTADSRTDTLLYSNLKAWGTTARLTASFRHNRTLKQFSNIDFEASIDALNSGTVNFDSLQFDFSLREDSLYLTNSIANISNEARSRITLSSVFSDSALTARIENFYLGNNTYSWQNQAVPTVTFLRNGNIQFEDFRLQNNQEFIGVRGNITPNPQDSLIFVMRDLNLGRISKLVNGKISFDGTMNGSLVTRSLLSRPSIQGDMTVQRLRLDERIVGDARFRSRFNPTKNRFDTSIDIVTDSTKYSEYLASNDNIGQNIHLEGYFKPPRPEAPRDTTFYFDANFKEIDLWIVPLLAPKVFQEVEGVASGEGFITGNQEDYDFNLDFQVANAFARPEFLNTNYFLNGHVVFDRQEWLVLDSLNVTDTKGGRGLVYGNVDINNFRPITYLDITMETNSLHLLNSSYDPDVPFYGSVSGSGTIRLSGANNDMYLRTQSPISVTSDSKLSIPLLEETELNENTKFIQFVDEFHPGQGAGGQASADQVEASINQMLQDLTFSERFNLDLQFNANNPMQVELIFDRVTGEVLSARGTGQIRLTMEEENTQMFGRYNITSGRYVFVGGEIFSRTLELENGGAIIWEGDPQNARLNIDAVYHARPSIAPLTGSTSQNQNDMESQRVPIDLVVEITGTLTSVENDYYFRIPSTFDISTSSTLSAQINELNRDEQQKLIQATSILLTGNFISYQNSSEAYSNIGQSFTRRSTYLNPLLSSQVISPLLSNQINALLNSDVSRFDIDFSLNAYNEIDLGVALRLYNDRLILRREGMITGSDNQTSLSERIGDLNATYRINRSLSVMAFHRQDQTLGNVTPTPGGGSTVDGIGLEAQVKFNTWKEFIRRIKNAILGIFGAGDKDKEENETIASGTTVHAIKNEEQNLNQQNEILRNLVNN